jgi:hypothetical protein
MAEVEREVHADGATLRDLTAASVRWAQVSDAIRATVRMRIADARSAQERTTKR